jgi:amidophosphoribosyltransferase
MNPEFMHDLHEECGVFGVFGHPDASRLTYLGLYALQHRGQESAGICASDYTQHRFHVGMGLVADIFNQDNMENLKGEMAIGHVRYSTAGSSNIKNAQPICVNSHFGPLSLAHNGNLVNADELRANLEKEGSIFRGTTDSEVMVHLMARSRKTELTEVIIDSLLKVKGAYSLLVMTNDTLIAVRDPLGMRPLCIGQLNDAWLVASESCAFDIIGGTYLQDIAPGEMIIIQKGKELRSIRAFPPIEEPIRQCIFELIYFSRPDSVVFGKNVMQARRALGRQLAIEHPAEADIVISIPDSANCHALGFAEQSGIPYDMGLIRNHYVGRTFIEPRQNIRDFGVKVKHNPVHSVLNGKRIVVVEDSIVRGTTSKKIIKLLRAAGAREIHMRIASPPYISPCYYGVDTPDTDKLIAANMSVEEIKDYIEVDSLGYISIEGMLKVMGDHSKEFCVSCFDGKYPESIEPPPDYLKPTQ